jgi:hypothetical protein
MAQFVFARSVKTSQVKSSQDLTSPEHLNFLFMDDVFGKTPKSTPCDTFRFASLHNSFFAPNSPAAAHDLTRAPHTPHHTFTRVTVPAHITCAGLHADFMLISC